MVGGSAGGEVCDMNSDFDSHAGVVTMNWTKISAATSEQGRAGLRRRQFLGCLAASAATLVGCRPSAEPVVTEDAGEQRAEPPAPVKLVVVDDEPLADAIDQQWELRGEGQLEVARMTRAELLESTRAPDADAIFFASRDLGTLVERGWLLSLSDDLLRDPNLAWSDVFDVIRLRETMWDRTPYALPLGSPPLVLIYRGDVWDELQLPPPTTWQQYHAALERASAAEREGRPELATLSAEPLGPGWAGLVLLARAAPYALHRGYIALWFDVDSMQPLIASPPFERALTELAASSDAALLDWTPRDALERVLRGDALAAITWPTRHVQGDANVSLPDGALRVAQLPGAVEAWHRGREQWTPRDREREGERVTLIGAAGRMAAVLKRSRQRSAVANLLVWFCGEQWGAQIGSASAATTLVRRQQLDDLAPWVPPQLGETAASQYAETLRSAMLGSSTALAPRVPAHDEYLAALDSAVADVVRKETSPTEALAAAAQTWESITERLGRDAQRLAYRRSLGL